MYLQARRVSNIGKAELLPEITRQSFTKLDKAKYTMKLQVQLRTPINIRGVDKHLKLLSAAMIKEYSIIALNNNV